MGRQTTAEAGRRGPDGSLADSIGSEVACAERQTARTRGREG